MADPRTQVIKYVSPVLERYPETYETLTGPVGVSSKPVTETTTTSPVTEPESPRTKVVKYVSPVLEQYPKTQEVLTTPVGPPGRPVYEPVVGTRATTYETVYSGYDEQLGTVRSNIGYVEGLPPGAKVTTSGGEEISREDALNRLRQQETNLVSNRTQIQTYEQEGYVVQKDAEGNLVFRKPPAEEFDYKSWWFERQKELNVGSFTAKAIAQGALNLFNPDYWSAVVRGKGGEYIYKQEYEDWKKIQEGKWFEVWAGRQVPAYENVIIPFVAAAAFTPALGYIGKAGASVTKTATSIGGKVLGKTMGYFPYVVGGVFTGVAVSKNITTYQFEKAGKIPKGSTLSSVIGTGMQFTSAIGGYRWAAGYKPVIGQYREGETVFLRKYLTTFRGKPVLGYGKPIYLTRGGTYGKIIGPMPSNLRGVTWEVSKPFMEKTPVYGKPPVWKPELGVVPSSTKYISPVGKPSVVPVMWKGKTGIVTGGDFGWQPKTVYQKSPFEISTKVLPKPIIRGAYQTHFFVLVYEPPPVVSVKPRVISFKPFKPTTKTAKDIIKSDKSIEKSFGGGQKQKTGTVTIQETKTITKQVVKPVVKTEKDVITSPISKEIVVPEELLKPVQTRKTERLTDLLKSKRFQEYKPVRVVSQDETMKLLTGVVSVQMQEKQQVRIKATEQEKTLRREKGLLFLPITIQTQEKIQDFDKDFVRETVKIYDYDFFKPVEPMHPVPPVPLPPTFFEPPPPPPKKPPPPPPDFSKEITNKIQVQPVYHVMLRSRQFKDGKRIAGKKYHRFTKKPLSYMDALAVAANKVDNTAKASFKLERTTGKPAKRPRGVKPWSNLMLEYENKGDDRFVELSSFRIDSPGEIREISMRGWNSPRKRKRRRRIR